MTEFSSGAVLFTNKCGTPYYCLVIRKADGYAGLPKGHIEKGETETTAALREIREETCVNAELIPGFRMDTEYTMENGVRKHVVYLLASFDNSKEEPRDNPDEPLRVALLSFDEAYKALSFENAREILSAAHKYITENCL